MTWIKPSFAWMLYRSGYGRKSGQERILGVDILRSGFEWALGHSCVASFDASAYGSIDDWRRALRATPVRIQWDPERNLRIEELPWRTIQVGLGGESVALYADEWVTGIEDVSELTRDIEAATNKGDWDRARELAPTEVPYPLRFDLARRIGA